MAVPFTGMGGGRNRDEKGLGAARFSKYGEGKGEPGETRAATRRAKMANKVSKAKINYFIDIAIGIGFLLAAVRGIVLLLAGSGGGYQGRRNPAYDREVLLLSRSAWKTFHNWSSIIMTVGVGVHMLLHWNWFVYMTRNIFKSRKKKMEACPVDA